MASGGYRPGAGRPKGAKAPKARTIKAVVDEAARESGMKPLDYMLAVMNDANADAERRDRMAIAAAPYVHSKAVDKALGKKEQQLEAAKDVAENGKYATPAPPGISGE